MSDIDDDSYANLLCHAAEEQLLRRQQLEEFITNYASTLPLLVLQILASDKLPERFFCQAVECVNEAIKQVISAVYDEMDGQDLPYHDDILFIQFFSDFLAAVIGTKNSRLRGSSPPGRGSDDEEKQFVSQFVKFWDHHPNFWPTRDLCFGYHVYQRYFHSDKLAVYVVRWMLLMANEGFQFDKLGLIYGTFHANRILPPENGYTRIFRSCEYVTLDQLREELLRRNTSAESDDIQTGQIINTVAVSYKHFAHDGELRICDRDLLAIHRFLVASRASNVRLWIDSKLPPTDDASFERWLTRGVRPFARYCTLVCPSAFEEKKRYWIQMERFISTAAQGIFFVTEDGVYYRKNLLHYGSLRHKMLTMMVGSEEIPQGMRREDRGKVTQWALGFLGDRDSISLCKLQGPKIDGLCNREFSEKVAMQNITLLIREHGTLVLPVEIGRSWNKDNPLILKGIPDQKLILPTWIGFLNPQNTRKVLFLNGTTLPEVIYGGLVGLEVTLLNKFVNGQKNEVVRKELREIPHSELLQMSVHIKSANRNEGREATTSRTDKRLVVSVADFEKSVLEKMAKKDGLADELNRCIQLLYKQSQGEIVIEKVETSPSGTLSEKETGSASKYLFEVGMEGLEAVTFPWECDWV